MRERGWEEEKERGVKDDSSGQSKLPFNVQHLLCQKDQERNRLRPEGRVKGPFLSVLNLSCL